MARVKLRRTGLLLVAVVLLCAVFGLNAMVALVWPDHPVWILGVLVVVDLAGFVGVFVIAHAALESK